jgi:molybdopterin synthase catalytic subunit
MGILKPSLMKEYLIEGPVSPEIIAAEIKRLNSRKDTGGHSLFLGQVREDLSEGRKVIAIEYSAYEGMVSSQAAKMKEEILAEFSDVLDITILHSIGIVVAGEISLLLIVTAGHRDHATRACSKLLELIKERLPVWKKELYDDTTHKWQENK